MINPKDRYRARAEAEAAQLRLSQNGQAKIRAAIAASMRSAAKAYPKMGEIAIAGAVAESSPRIEAALQSIYSAGARHFGREIFQGVKTKGHHGPAIIKASLWDAFGAALQLFYREWIGTKVTYINRTTEQQIRGVVRSGMDQGLSVDSIAASLIDNAMPMSQLRAHVIARTESHFASTFGAQTAAELTGLDMQREWVAAHDSRTRRSPPDAFDHAGMDGKRTGMKEPFNVSGQSLMYPGDPRGSAANVINCRCQIAYWYD